MRKPDASLTIGQSLLISVIVLVAFTGFVLFLTFGVSPLPASQETESSTRSFEMLSVVLSLFAGGCMAGYFSFDYSKVGLKHRKVALLISWLFVSSMYLLLSLIMYSLRRAGALQIVDGWAKVILFFATYAFLNGLILFERWKMGQFKAVEE
jgi:hypothetical protein